MTTPVPSYDLAQSQYTFYKSATRLANLWYALTIIVLVLWILGIVLACVGVFLGAGTLISLINSLGQYGF